MSDTSTGTLPPNAAPTPSPAPPDGRDPLARLHKMSTTAGISSQEYVAINIPSIVACLLGLVSVVALIEPVLLVLPLAAVVVGVVALVQIRNSNGTQTGRALAWSGIVLALLLGGTQFTLRAIEASASRADQRAAADLLARLGDRVIADDYAGAYGLFTERFRQRVPLETFTTVWQGVERDVAELRSIGWNGVPMQFEQEGTGATIGQAMAVFTFSREGAVGRQGIIMREEGGAWQVDDLPTLFPSQRQNPGADAGVQG